MKTKNNGMSRRNFLGAGLAMTAMPVMASFSTVPESIDLYQYEPNLRDRLWMWGHLKGSILSDWGMLDYLPDAKSLDIADAIESMGIPNACVIPGKEVLEPDDSYFKIFLKAKRVAWCLLAETSGNEVIEKHNLCAFEIGNKTSNLVSYYLDDFFHGNADPRSDQNTSPAHLSVEQLNELQKEIKSLNKKIDLTCVLYSNQLHPAIKHHIDSFDAVSFWTWNATDLSALEENFKRYREIVSDKPTLLGIYMWDFGSKKPITMELMKNQLMFALEKFKQHEIEGLIFHCTPLVDIGLEAVEYSKKWIAEYGDFER